MAGRKSNELVPTGEDRIDIYIEHLLNGLELSQDKQDRFDIMLHAQALLKNGYSQATVVKLLTSDKNEAIKQLNGGKKLEMWTAYRIILDSLQIFGVVSQASKDGKRNVMYENFMRIAKSAESAGDFTSAIRALEKACMLDDLFSKEIEGIDPEIFMVPMPIFFSNNKLALEEEERKRDLVLQEIDGIFQHKTDEELYED